MVSQSEHVRQVCEHTELCGRCVVRVLMGVVDRFVQIVEWINVACLSGSCTHGWCYNRNTLLSVIATTADRTVQRGQKLML